MRIVTTDMATRQEAEGDAVVARVDELDAREHPVFFPGHDRVLDRALAQLVDDDDHALADERRRAARRAGRPIWRRQPPHSAVDEAFARRRC